MQYKVEKDTPVPGRIKNLTVTINSLVDRPANNQTFLSIKGMNNMPLTDIQKKELQDAGLTPEEITKADTDSGILAKIKKFFFTEEAKKTETAPETSAAPLHTTVKEGEPLTLDAISKMFDEKIERVLAVKAESDPEAIALKKQNEELEAQIKADEEEIARNEGISKELEVEIKKNQELQKKYEELQIRKTGGNGTHREGGTSATPEQIKKRDMDNLFAGTAIGNLT